MSGCVGDGPAAGFLAFCAVPGTAQTWIGSWPNRMPLRYPQPSIYALCGGSWALPERRRHGELRHHALRLPDEFTVLALCHAHVSAQGWSIPSSSAGSGPAEGTVPGSLIFLILARFPTHKLESIMIENNLDVGGAVVFWSIAEWTDRGRLAARFAQLELEALVPGPRPAPAALRAALEDIFGGPRMLIRPLASKDGFVVVHEDRGLSGNQYKTELAARVMVGNPPTLSFSPGTAGQ